MSERKVLEIENAKIEFPHFSGAPDKFHMSGQRDFTLILDEELAYAMWKDGWRVKKTGKLSEDAEKYIKTDDMSTNLIDEKYIIKVKVNMDSPWPPKIYRVCGNRAVQLNKTTIGDLDTDYIVSVDCQISSYNSGNDGKLSAYLSTLYAVVEESRLENKWSSFIYGDDGAPF